MVDAAEPGRHNRFACSGWTVSWRGPIRAAWLLDVGHNPHAASFLAAKLGHLMTQNV